MNYEYTKLGDFNEVINYYKKLLGMIDRQTGGKLFFEEHDTEDLWKDEFADIRRRKIGFVFQDFYLMDSLSVRENIMLPKILDKKSAKVYGRIAEICRTVRNYTSNEQEAV